MGTRGAQVGSRLMVEGGVLTFNLTYFVLLAFFNYEHVFLL
jgi:hypothetical protein